VRALRALRDRPQQCDPQERGRIKRYKFHFALRLPFPLISKSDLPVFNTRRERCHLVSFGIPWYWVPRG